MKLAQVKQGMNHVLQLLAPIMQVNNIEYTANSLSWRGRTRGIYKEVYYPIEYQGLIDLRQYSILLTDGSFLQIYYDFDNQGLTAARLAYYPAPVSTKSTKEDIFDAADIAIERNEDELYEHLYNCIELLEGKSLYPVNTSHIRFDYDKNVTAHEPSHIQLGAIQELRVPANFFPQPLAFIELIGPLIGNLGIFKDEHVQHARSNSLVLSKLNKLTEV